MIKKSKNYISHLKNSICDVSARGKHNRKSLGTAIKLTKHEIFEDLKKIGKDKNLKSTTALLRTIGGTTNWISTSYLQYLSSPVPISKYKIPKKVPKKDNEILNHIISNSEEDHLYSDKEIFNAIYFDRNRTRQYDSYESKLKIKSPKNVTIILISGVFNELFTTAAFERGAEHLCNQYDIDYLVPKISGIKGHRHNCKMLKDQLFKYIEDNPTKKLWPICYSKGGVDALYFLRKHKPFASKYILGLSTIAAPILGTDHFNRRLIKVLRNTTISQEFFHLDSTKREGWFKRNHDELPKNLFYTSLAFVSDWHESHISMMLSKILLRIKNPNDGMIDVANAHFPNYFSSINLGEVKGHHLSGSRSSSYSQEALIEALIIFLTYKQKI